MTASLADDRTDAAAGRLRLLRGLALLPLLVVAARMVHVQTVLPPRFEAAWTETKTRRQPTPARTGRILAADGVVVARDLTRLDLEMDYRWLQQPPDPTWLRREALARLPAADRRDAARRAASEAAVLADRDRLHDDLRALLGDDFDRRRDAIDARVQRMRRVVIDKRLARVQPSASGSAPDGLLAEWWHAVAGELTAPPHRGDEPFVLLEETIAHPLAEDVSPEVVELIASAPRRFRGLSIATRLRRDYPLGDFAAHVIGYRRPGDDGAVAGQTGIERSYDRTLRGVPGEAAVVVDWAGREQTRSDVRLARDGDDVTLTLHSAWQRAAETILDEAIADREADGGCLILMDARTGAVRVAASGPRVDLNLFVRPDAAAWDRMQADPRRPLFPRLTAMALPPGSTFKLATAAAALESGWDAGRELHCRGYLDRPDRQRCALFVNHGLGHGDISLPTALARSCNVFFYRLADGLGETRLVDGCDRFGFGLTTGCDLPSEAAGSLPRSGDAATEASRRRQLAIGQGQLTATPLQIARLAAAIVNGGRLVRPRFSTEAPQRSEPIPDLSPATLDTIRAGMRQAVDGELGTARSLARLPIAVAGKTGTAETATRSHAWFAGYLPAEQPRFAVVAVLEHGGGGGSAAAPMVGRLVEAIAAAGDFDQW